MKKILISLSIVAAVAAVVVGATTSFFSDTETSTGNTFTAGAIDLKVDSTQHYNNMVCTLGLPDGSGGVKPSLWQPENGQTVLSNYPAQNSECGGTWTMKDLVLGTDKFFNFADVKPGDSGEDTISLHVLNNDAWVCATVSNLTNNDNSQTEPEALIDINGMATGELQQTMDWKVWRDDGAGNGVAGDNIQNGTEQTLTSGHPTNGVLALYDSTTGTPLTASSTAYLGVSWSLPAASGNETQTDSLTGDISFNVVQSRNNSGFKCADVNLPSGDNGEALGPDSVNLGSAGDFVIVAKTAITDAGAPLSAITGNIAIDPAAGSAITDVSCTNVLGGGKIYNDGGYTGGYNANVGCEVVSPVTALAVRSAMETAYTDAAGRTGPDGTNLYAGNLGGQTFAPGLYKWTTGVTIPTDVTLSGGVNDVWIFQISGTLDIASGGSPSGGADVVLTGGAQAKNVFWQVAGATTLGTYSTFNGTILAKTNIAIQTGAVLNGRALAQTAVTLDDNTVTLP